MGWNLKCVDSGCKQRWAGNIVDLIAFPRDSKGWFVCPCGKHGYIEKNFKMQEAGEDWRPYLRGLIPLGLPNEVYQPFVFLVSYEPSDEVTDIWFCYYKDLRSIGGRLKMGHGPGGPPVLHKKEFLELLTNLIAAHCLTKEEILNAISPPTPQQMCRLTTS